MSFIEIAFIFNNTLPYFFQIRVTEFPKCFGNEIHLFRPVANNLRIFSSDKHRRKYLS